MLVFERDGGRRRVDATCFSTSKSTSIEIKPSVGDDYPAVLRQMKASKSQVLFLENYSGTGATENQFVKTFQTSGKRVIFAREIR